MSVWETKKLGEVIKLEYGKPLPKEIRDEGGKYPAYGANEVKWWKCKLNLVNIIAVDTWLYTFC